MTLRTDGREHRSRRFAKAIDPTQLGLTLTGHDLTAWTHEAGDWVARARYNVCDDLDAHDEDLLASRTVETPVGATTGAFGQLGLRDVRLVSHADGSPLRDGRALWLSATSAGPGHFDSGHTSIWRLDPATCELDHSADLWFRRPDRPGVFGDHATHVVRDDERWLVATSTWGDFRLPTTRAGRRTRSTLRTTLATTQVDLLRGTHVLDTVELPLPTDGLGSIAIWDPHLVRHDYRWHVGFVSARRFFDFHPALAVGESLDSLALAGAAPERTATEGTTLVPLPDGRLVVAASDGRDNRRPFRERYPVWDASMTAVGHLRAPYPTNIPWPTVVPDGDGWLLIAFNGRPTGGPLLPYGTHGDLVVMRSA